jgi:hypothetical protein
MLDSSTELGGTNAGVVVEGSSERADVAVAGLDGDRGEGFIGTAQNVFGRFDPDAL